jgi:hypothetical protein
VVQVLCESDAPRWGEEDDTMTRHRRHTPDQIIRKLAEGNKRLAGANELDEVCRHLETANRPGTAGSPSTAA